MDTIGILDDQKRQLESTLNEIVTNIPNMEESLKSIIEHNLFPGGKRLRAQLTVLMYKAAQGKKGAIYTCAAVPELIHTATLMLDDLPCMDNSDFRRNKPSSHKLFGEANTILAAFGLAAEALHILSDKNNLVGINDQSALNLVNDVSLNMGLTGLIVGQVADLQRGKDLKACNNDIERLDYITHNKTVVLFEVCAMIASVLAEVEANYKNNLLLYARNIGMALQIFDDIQDSLSDKGLSFSKLYGVEGAKDLLMEKIKIARECIQPDNIYAQLLYEMPLLLFKGKK